MPVFPDVASRMRRVGREVSGVERLADHPRRRPVLDRAAGIEPLGLGVQLDARQVRSIACQTKERRVADRVQHTDAIGLSQGFANGRHISDLKGPIYDI